MNIRTEHNHKPNLCHCIYLWEERGSMSRDSKDQEATQKRWVRKGDQQTGEMLGEQYGGS